ncbi:tRNA (guanine(26)-N(2))-dimethyltransferase isoform X2 [Carex littledalei]|uniref:tRNA (guanine(26)-N(2))-dimethyltransferase n=1 Tax=Carex littledalei TaxID=544730 RepID=A0A833R6E9_9POAL|nr:tRNA (guanine(26)-N(2))-dimethyltransferase isoform X2 [Carex littledalei]
MTSLFLVSPHRTLPPLSFTPLSKSLQLPPRCQIQTRARIEAQLTASTSESERGVEFTTGDLFYRRESATARDLAILSSSISHRHLGRGLRVLDAMCGCAVRSVRYLSQGGAEFVWANDAFEGCRPRILANLSSAAPRFSRDARRWVVTHFHANRLFSECYLQKEFFDLVDIDSFGGDSSFLRSALCVVKIGGLLYLTSTDGRSSGGHRPSRSLASYGAYVRPMPFSNEIGLRMLIGGAVREASALGFHVSPVFSYYSYHGPVFRVMLQLGNGKDDHMSRYGFIGYCNKCGHSQTFSWDELGQISCPCGSTKVVVSGPLWTGPLHSAENVREMLELAREWGWAYTNSKNDDLDKLLNLMIDECDPQLPPGYIKVDEIARRAKVNSPPVSTLIHALQVEGYAASRSHVEPNAIKTNCPMASCINFVLKIRT